ncbi:MAG: aminotransferase class IV [Acidimicrobiia bacterium]
MFIWINGEVIAAELARVSPLDHGLTVGDGVFETLRVYDGVPFAWTRHLDRMERSAIGLGITPPDRNALRRGAAAVLEANELDNARLRLTCTSGMGPPGSQRGDGPALLVAVAVPLTPPEAFVDVVTVPWTRNERGALAGIKTTSYGENVRALAYAFERDAHEAIFANTRGELCEGSSSNVFLVRSGVLHTPPVSSGCLAGVTRALVIELCAQAGITYAESELPLAALAAADEAFITSSPREVVAIRKVDGRLLPSALGPVTVELAARYRNLVETTPDP